MIKYDGKTWMRTCFDCGVELKYKYKRSADSQEEKNGKCLKCGKLKIFDNIYKNSDGVWCRTCPQCQKELSYKKRSICLVRHYKNSLCKRCFQIGDKAFWYGKEMSESTKKKISNSIIGRKPSFKTRQKLSESKKGNKNPFFKKLFDYKHRENLRCAIIKRIKKYGIHSKNFNPNACKFIDAYGKKNGYNFQHALNGGEISVGGYLLDGYDKDRNIIFEYDERHHNREKFIKKDLFRQNYIIEKMKPTKFIRYDEWNNRLYDALINEDIEL